MYMAGSGLCPSREQQLLGREAFRNWQRNLSALSPEGKTHAYSCERKGTVQETPRGGQQTADEAGERGNTGKRKEPFLHRPCLNNADSKHTWNYDLNKKRITGNTWIPHRLRQRHVMDAHAADMGMTSRSEHGLESCRLGPNHGPTTEEGCPLKARLIGPQSPGFSSGN